MNEFVGVLGEGAGRGGGEGWEELERSISLGADNPSSHSKAEVENLTSYLC